MQLKPGDIIHSAIFPEQVELIQLINSGAITKLICKGSTGKFYERHLDEAQMNSITIQEKNVFNGDPKQFRIAVESYRLGLAYEYDPYFSLSISRVDPLPHQLEAVYDYFLKTPRIRFLLADDPGAGKTIMAGLLIKELKIRGLIKRILIITPANLTFQWQRELKDKFRENFEIIRGDVLRTNYGLNPWQDKNQVIASVTWASQVDDANQSLLRATWDLVIVDEAHKMSASDDEHKTFAYKLGEELALRTDHLLLMTATPHKGDPEHFRLFLQLLDCDIYADIQSLEVAIREREAPFYLRRVKEAMVTFPDPETGKAKSLFTKRNVRSLDFQIKDEEWDLYNALTSYVEENSIRAAQQNTAASRAVGFTMAMLQRRFASSLYALRRSLERMKARREEILRDPEGYRKKQIEKRLPDNFDDLPDSEREDLLNDLEETVISYDPSVLRMDIEDLKRLIDQAIILEKKEIEAKITKLRDTLQENGLFQDKKIKLLIFTEHKDTLEYLAGDGQNERPLGKLIQWGFEVAVIAGGMKIGDRNTPGTRIFSELDFRENKQILVATEAAGEGINLQFCWLMINYDIPWNPVRLEQRMGRIHRYGQEKDCLVLNFVATNTREGRVMEKLFERIRSIEDDLDPERTGKIFNVLGDVFPSNLIEKMIRDMYARNLTEDVIKDRIVEQVDTEKFKHITSSALEGLAKKELNLSAIVGKTVEARERRLVPEVIEDYFREAAPLHGLNPKETKKDSHIYNIGKVPRNLWPKGEKNEPIFGTLGKEYGKIVFSKDFLLQDALLEWVTPGHPLFEVIREESLERCRESLSKGAFFYDLYREVSARFDLFLVALTDGMGRTLHQRLFVTETTTDSLIKLKQPTVFLDIVPAVDYDTRAEELASLNDMMPSLSVLESFLFNNGLLEYKAEVEMERRREVEVVVRHIEMSLIELIHRQNSRLIDLLEQRDRGDNSPQLLGHISQTETRILDLENRRETRKKELDREREIAISSITHLGASWVLPHPERNVPEIRGMVSNDKIEMIAIQRAIEYEESRGYRVKSVESENRGFDLISRKPHPEDPDTAIDVRFIEVKGRYDTAEVALTSNEYKTAQRLQQDYYLYVVYNCSTVPELHIVRDPARMGWKPIVKIEHYLVKADEVLKSSTKDISL
ncbi:MAG TPA: DUF3883 domain-containing protein [Spirochaetota bacterium]|nr:DUF3883 domain-containing protein [Spirochaetota bacterium]